MTRREETKENEEDWTEIHTEKQVLGIRAFNVETVSREDILDLPVKKSLELCQRGSSVIQWKWK